MNFLRILLVFFCLSLTIPSFADQLIVEPDEGDAPLLNAIDDAKQSIDLAIYGFTDKKITQALTAAKSRGVAVRIILEPTPYKNNNENFKTVAVLKSAGITTKTLNEFKLLHEKLIIIDHQTAWVMSFNFTYSTFNNERNFALILNDPTQVNTLETLFSADYDGKPITVDSNTLLISPNNSRKVLNYWLGQAKQQVDIYAQNISDYQTIGTLAKLSQRGVKVQLITSLTQEQRPPILAKAENFLKRKGIEIRYLSNLIVHAKAFAIDGRCVIIGSLNLTAPSFDNNREVSAVSCDPSIQPEMTTIFQQDWAVAKPMLK